MPSIILYKRPTVRLSSDHRTDCPKQLTPWMRKNFGKLFARIPLPVLMDKLLSGADIRVFAAMAYWVRQSNVCSKAHAEIALVAGVNVRQVRRSLVTLGKQGHISSAISNKPKAVCSYQLNGELFDPATRTAVRSMPSRAATDLSLTEELRTMAEKVG